MRSSVIFDNVNMMPGNTFVKTHMKIAGASRPAAWTPRSRDGLLTKGDPPYAARDGSGIISVFLPIRARCPRHVTSFEKNAAHHE